MSYPAPSRSPQGRELRCCRGLKRSAHRPSLRLTLSVSSFCKKVISQKEETALQLLSHSSMAAINAEGKRSWPDLGDQGSAFLLPRRIYLQSILLHSICESSFNLVHNFIRFEMVSKSVHPFANCLSRTKRASGLKPPRITNYY